MDKPRIGFIGLGILADVRVGQVVIDCSSIAPLVSQELAAGHTEVDHGGLALHYEGISGFRLKS